MHLLAADPYRRNERGDDAPGRQHRVLGSSLAGRTMTT
jgi:hypothetical protein